MTPTPSPTVAHLCQQLDTLLAEVGERCGHAVRCLLRRIAIHRRQLVAGSWYTELSISYLRHESGVAYATARTAWNLVRDVLGWASVHINEAREMLVE